MHSKIRSLSHDLQVKLTLSEQQEEITRTRSQLNVYQNELESAGQQLSHAEKVAVAVREELNKAMGMDGLLCQVELCSFDCRIRMN